MSHPARHGRAEKAQRTWLLSLSLSALVPLAIGLTASPQPTLAAADTVTTELQPGPNLAGWTQPRAGIKAIFDDIPELELVYAWDAENRWFRWAARTDSGVLGNLQVLTPGMGLWLSLTGEQTVTWTRPVVEQAGSLLLHEGWNLVAWTGDDRASTSDALQDLDDILTAAADGSGVRPTSLIRGGALWLNVSARKRWEQPEPVLTVTPEMLAAIDELPWVADGLTFEERQAVRGLHLLAEESPRAFVTVMGSEWIANMLTHVQRVILRDLGNMATFDSAAPATILSMPFMQSVESEDGRVVRHLYWIAVGDTLQLNSFLKHLQDLHDTETISGVDIFTSYLRHVDVEYANAILEMEWFHGGEYPRKEWGSRVHVIGEHFVEQRAVGDLFDLLLSNRSHFASIVEKQWMQDSLSREEGTVLHELTAFAERLPDVVRSLVPMPFLDTVDEEDVGAMQFFESISWPRGEDLRQLIAHYDAEGGLADKDLRTMRLTLLRLKQSAAVPVLEAIPWLKDGIGDDERRAAHLLQALALEAEPVLMAVGEKAWVRDGLTPEEVSVVNSFHEMSADRYGAGATVEAVAISAMPFLDAVDAIDAAAVSSLSSLAHSNEEHFRLVLDHPAFAGGITDGEAVVVAALGYTTLYEVRARAGALIPEILDPGRVQYEVRTLNLPYAGEMQISVLHLDHEQHRTIDILEELVRAHEAYMRAPFPKRYIGLLAIDGAVRRGSFFGFGQVGGFVAIDPGHEDDRYLIAHELAHAYWPFPPGWMQEGGAEFLTSRVTQLEAGSPCPYNTLHEYDVALDEWLRFDTPPLVSHDACPYRLGNALFADLHDALGDETFREGFRRLYLALRDDAHDAECSGIERGVCYLKQAFVSDASPGAAALAEPVINQQYYGNPDGPASDP